MKKHTIIFITLIVVLLLGGFFYQTKNSKVEKESVNLQTTDQAGLFIQNKNIDKIGVDDLPLSGVQFSLKTNNNTFEGLSEKDSDEYYFEEAVGGPTYFERAYNTLSQVQKEYVDSIDDFQDIMNFYSNTPSNCKNSSVLEMIYNNASGNQIENISEIQITPGQLQPTYCVIMLPTYLTLEETNVPTGYVKEKYLVPGMIVAEYYGSVPHIVLPLGSPASDTNSESIPEVGTANYNYSDYPVRLTGVGVISGPSEYYIQYGNVDRNELTGLDIEEALRVWKRKADDSCGAMEREQREILPNSKATYPDETPYISGSNMDSIMELFSGNGYELCIKNQKGKVSLEANSYVNNVESITTSVNQTLEYKVVVNNTGTGDAIDNVIRSTIPEGFIYVEGSASDGGVYKDGYIEWNVERLEEGKKKELTYKAFASKIVVAGQDYIGNASVETFGLEEKVESNRTMVRLSLQNPYTAAPIKIVLLILTISAGVVIFLTHYYQQQRQQQTQE